MLQGTIAAVFLVLFCAGCGSLSRTFMNAGWRDRWQKPEAVIQSLAIQPGDHVADLGAGGGYFTFRLADAVGPSGKVYAVDVDEGSLKYITRQAQKRGYSNIEAVLAKYDDPLLPKDGVDLVFLCNAYHHLENRADYFQPIAHYLRPDGRIAVIDYQGQSWLFRLLGHQIPTKETVLSEMEAAGYTLAKDFDLLTRQHFQVFTPNRS